MGMIDKDTVINMINAMREEGYCDAREIRDRIMFMPEIDAEPVKRGRWIDKPDEYCETNIIRHCSECGWSVFKCNPLYDFGRWNYCPHCGAKMQDGGAENGDV